MQKIMYNILLVVLLGLTLYFFFEARTAKTLLSEKTANLEKVLEEVNQNCEERLSQLKDHYENKLAVQNVPAQGEGLVSFIEAIRERKQQSREKILGEVVSSLQLNEDGVKGLMDSIEFFEKQKKDLMDRVRSRGGNIFDPDYMEQMNVCREQTLTLLEKSLPQEKFNMFMELGFDQKLDLKIR